MTSPFARDPRDAPFPLGFREFVAMAAMIMVLHALGIDMMLPALPEIGATLGISTPNEQQWIVSTYMIGFGVGQIVYGPLADRFGRRPVLLPSIFIFLLAGLVASVAASWDLMLAARFVQGAAGAGGRVLVVSIVRDRFVGRTMARVMSLAGMVFMLGPILAPMLGELVMMAGPWRWIFRVLSLFSLGIMIWAWCRLPETLPREARRPIETASILGALGKVVRTRASIGYTLAGTMTFGAILGFVSSSQQLFAEALGAPEWFALGFALSSVGLMIAALINSRIVEHFGSRRVSHSALIALIAVATLHMGWAGLIGDTLASFVTFQFLTMLCIGLMGPNFNAMAMEPMGEIAGTASSVQGTIATIGAALFSVAVGQRFDGSTLPVIEGYLVAGLAALVIILITERGRLFRPQHPDPQ